MNSKRHVVFDSRGRPIQIYLRSSQISAYFGAAEVLRFMPCVKFLLAEWGYGPGLWTGAMKQSGSAMH